MRIALAQINPTIGAFAENRQKILENIKQARQQKAEIIVCPELALSGYPPEDLLLLPEFIEEMERSLHLIASECQGIIAIIGLARKNPQRGEKGLLNSACIIENGKIIGFQDKILLPDYDVFSERRYFDPGTSMSTWPLKGKNIALFICEDIWGHSELLEYVTYATDPVKLLAHQQVDLVINLSASPFFEGVKERRRTVCARAAATLQAPVLLVNQVGGNDSLIFDGHSFVINPDGELLAEAKGFQEELLFWERGEKTKNLPSYDSLQTLLDALVLGTRDYFRKVGYQQALLGLSGGIDSALTAYIVALALGKENVLALSLPSRFTSQESLEDAREQASLLGIALKEISIEKPFSCYLTLLSPLLTKQKEGRTEENLQARIRGMILMAYSNQLGHMVVATGNKSELAVGYSTLYGDMCGGLEILGDVTKSQVIALCKWLNRNQIQIVERIIEKPPSAELKEGQKDSDTLPPYAQLDRIVEGYVHDHLSSAQIAVQEKIDEELVKEIVRKIHRNEYKRQQAPFSLRVTKRSFSEGRRFPIAQQWNA